MKYLTPAYEVLQSAGQWTKANPIKTTAFVGLAGVGLAALLVPDVQHAIVSLHQAILSWFQQQDVQRAAHEVHQAEVYEDCFKQAHAAGTFDYTTPTMCADKAGYPQLT